MSTHDSEAAHHGYAADLVPPEQQGSGWKVFFIVAGSLCGLPCFILAAQIFGSLGLREGSLAVALGGVISGILGAMTSATGSRSRMGLALLADRSFGPVGARAVKLVIAVALMGWFGVNIGVLGTTGARALSQISGHAVPALAVGLPVCLLIAGITIAGATGLERLGKVLVPCTLIILALSFYLVSDRMAEVLVQPGSGALSFGSAVSAMVGTYVVGIVIQPDYGRFVRAPLGAAAGSGLALALFYPGLMIISAFASLVTGAPELISAMIILGVGIPALVILLLGAWIDSSACLYSASLSLANQFPRVNFIGIVLGITLVGVVLVMLGADTAFIPFLIALSVCLPPLASVMVLSAWLNPEGLAGVTQARCAAVAWVCGAGIGLLSNYGVIGLSQVASIDAILASAVVYVALRALLLRRAPVRG